MFGRALLELIQLKLLQPLKYLKATEQFQAIQSNLTFTNTYVDSDVNELYSWSRIMHDAVRYIHSEANMAICTVSD